MTRKELAEADEEAPAEVVRHGLDPEVEKAIAVFKKHFRSVAEAFVYTNSDLRTGGITLSGSEPRIRTLQVELKRVFIRLRYRGRMNSERVRPIPLCVPTCTVHD
eukprot:3317252-Rhodomonas_salina.1